MADGCGRKDEEGGERRQARGERREEEGGVPNSLLPLLARSPLLSSLPPSPHSFPSPMVLPSLVLLYKHAHPCLPPYRRFGDSGYNRSLVTSLYSSRHEAHTKTHPASWMCEGKRG